LISITSTAPHYFFDTVLVYGKSNIDGAIISVRLRGNVFYTAILSGPAQSGLLYLYTIPITFNIYAEASEPSTLTITCGSGFYIWEFSFASYGTPTGSNCDSFATSSCDLSTTKAQMNTACVGLNSCSVPATHSFFGDDPCYGSPKSLKVCATCSFIPTPSKTPSETPSFRASGPSNFPTDIPSVLPSSWAPSNLPSKFPSPTAAPTTTNNLTHVSASAFEGQQLVISCSYGFYISGFTFASYGTPIVIHLQRQAVIYPHRRQK
jgi:hypothetical protein